MAVMSKLDARLYWTEVSGHAMGGAAFKTKLEAALEWVNGTGLGQADILWAATRPVASGANDDIDFAGVLSSAFGVTITAAEMVAIFIKSSAANTTNLTLGQGSTNPMILMGGTAPTTVIRPGGVRIFAEKDAAGLCTVTGGSADTLRIANASGAAASYDIAILARSA